MFVPVADLHCLPSLAYNTYAFHNRRFCRRQLMACTCCSSALILLTGPLLIHITRLPSSFLPAYYSTVPLIYVCTCCRTAPLSITGLLLVPVADMPSFSSLAYCSYLPLAYPHFCYTTFVRVVEPRCYALLLHFYLHCTFCLFPPP